MPPSLLCVLGKGETRNVEALKPAVGIWALKRRAEPVAQPATDEAVVGCVSFWAKGGESLKPSSGQGRTRMKPAVTAQLHSSSGRSSKVLKDHTHIEAVVELAGVGTLVLDVDSGGGYSLRAYPEDSEDPSRDLLAVGVVHAEGVVAVHPEGLSAVGSEQGALRSERSF